MKKYIPVLFCISLFITQITYAQNYTISTVAGNGIDGYSGDGQAATNAELNNPINSGTDKSQNLLIPDGYNQRVRKVDANGIITTIAGNGVQGYSGDGGQATDAELSWPLCVVSDDSGNLYIVELLNDVVRKVNTKGVISTIAGVGYSGSSGDNGPATDAELNAPRGVAVDDSGNIFIADQSNYRIREVRKGIITTIAGTGTAGYTGDGGPATAATLDQPTEITLDHAGNIYETDFINNVIRKINSKGIISTFAGNGVAGFAGDGGPATDAEINNPNGISADKDNNVYIADDYSERIRKVDTAGIITTIAGTGNAGHTGDGGPATAAELSSPISIFADTIGNLYITENITGNDDVRKLFIPCPNNASIAPAAPIICNGQSVVLSVNGGGTTFTWSPSTGLSTTTGDSVTASPTTETTYTVVTTISKTCSDTATDVVNIIPAPNTPTITVSVTGDTLFSSATTDNQWNFDGSSINGATDSFYVIKGHIKGWYTVTVTNEANGCGTTSDSTTSVNQLSIISDQLSIYPNPTNSIAFIKINSSVKNVYDWNLQIADVLGRTVYKTTSLNYLNELDITKLSAAMYFITITNGNDRAVFKLVKQN